MPLTQAQKDNIYSILTSSLELPNDKASLQTAMKQLEEALLTTVEDAHPFTWVSKCFRSPTTYFPGLEKLNAETTYVYEVQEYILSIISTAIETRLAQLPKMPQHWKNKAVLQFFADLDNKALVFTTPELAIDGGENPWALPALEGKNYNRALRMHEEVQVFDNDYMQDDDDDLMLYLQPIKYSFYVDVTTKMPLAPPITQSFFVCELPATFNNDNEENAFIEKHQKQAEELAEKHATRVALAYLEKKPLSDSLITKLSADSGVRKLITMPYYFEEIAAGRLKANRIINLTQNECDNLADHIIIDLMENKILTSLQAKALTLPERRVAIHPAHYQSLKNKAISLESFNNLSERRSHFITFPTIANLIQQGKLDFRTAMELPFYTFPIFKILAYTRLLASDTMDWHVFGRLTELQCKFMAHKQAIPLLLADVISLNKVANYTAEQTLGWRLFTAIFNPTNESESYETILPEMTDPLAQSEHVSHAIADYIQIFLTSNAHLFTPEATERLLPIIMEAKLDPSNNWENTLCTLMREAENMLNKTSMNNFVFPLPAVATVFFPAKKRARTNESIDEPATKRARTNTDEKAETTKRLCHQIMQVASVSEYVSTFRMQAAAFR